MTSRAVVMTVMTEVRTADVKQERHTLHSTVSCVVSGVGVSGGGGVVVSGVGGVVVSGGGGVVVYLVVEV